MLTSYHVHSCWSDGEGEMVEYVRAAGSLGLSELGISDHYVLTPDRRRFPWNMPVNGVEQYVELVQTAAGEADDNLIVRLGIEADYIPETADEMRDILASQPFDYVIGSVHFVDGFPIDECPENWEALSQAERDVVIRGYWTRIRELAESRMYDIAAHLDLTKKFGFSSSVDLSLEISAALDAIASSDMSVEVSTAGWYAKCAEQYPSASILRGCFDRDIPVLVTADAHSPANLDRGYKRAYRLIQEIGFTEVSSYSGRMRIPDRIGD